jgi:hypothetical protein
VNNELFKRRLALLGLAPRTLQPPRPLTGRRPRVSVVVPCYNYGHYLPDCVDSILSQDGVAADIVIVDDASPDGSAEVARTMAAADERIQVICHETNKGHIATYNDGLSTIEGDYAVLLSADDVLTPGSLARAASLLEANPTVGMVYGHAVAFTNTYRPPVRTEPIGWTIWRGRDWLADRCRTGRNALRSPEAVMRTSVLREIGLYRPDLPHAGDFEMWMRAARASDIGHIAGVDQALYRVHDKNMHSATYATTQAKGTVFELEQRLASFEAVLDDSASDRELLAIARRSLARRALTEAIRAYHRGEADVWPVDELADFAGSLCPRSELRAQWAALERRKTGAKRSFHPLYQPRERIHQVVVELDRWRFRQAGI